MVEDTSSPHNARSPNPHHKVAVKRQPDTALQDVLSSFQKNTKFKRMLIFSLRSLSDLATPPSPKARDNALTVLESPSLVALLECADTFKGDNEVAFLISKIFLGISIAFKDEPTQEQERQASHVKQMGLCLVNTLSNGPQDHETLLNVLETLKNLKYNGDMSPMASSFVQSLNSKMTPDLLHKLLAALNTIAADPTALSALVNAGISSKAFNAIGGRKNCDEAASAFLSIMHHIAQVHKQKPEDLDYTIEIMETYKQNYQVQEAGSKALSAMIKQDDLKRCLKILQTSPPDDPQRASAATTLACMSYISASATELVQAQGISTLVSVIQQAYKELQATTSADPKAYKAILGAAKMIESVSLSSSQYRDDIIKAGGLQALIQIFGHLSKTFASKPSAQAASTLAVVCASINSLQSSPEAARTTATVYSTATGLMKTAAAYADLLVAIVDLLLGASQHHDIITLLISANASSCIGKAVTEKSVHGNLAFYHSTISCGHKLLPGLSLDKINELAIPLARVIADNTSSLEVAEAGADFLLAVAKAGSKQASAAPEAALNMLLDHSDSSPPLAFKAREVLELLCTEADVKKTLHTLGTDMTNAKTRSDVCLRSLAAVNGLYQLPRLRHIMEAQHAEQTVAKGLRLWVESAKFDEQQRIISAGCMCLSTLASSWSSPLDDLAHTIAEIIQLPQMKQLRDRQANLTENSLIDTCSLLECLCATKNFSGDQAVFTVIEDLLRVIRKYSDSKQPQAACIRGMDHLAAVNGTCAHKVVEIGALKAVLANMHKVATFENVQEAGCALMHTLASTDDSLLEKVKAADPINVIKNAERMHSKNAQLKRHVEALLQLLIPADEVEKILMSHIREVEDAVRKGDWKRVNSNMEALNQIISNPEASRIAARCDLARALDTIINADIPQNMKVEVYASCAFACKNLSARGQGVKNLLGKNGVKNIIKLFETLDAAHHDDGLKACLAATRRLIRKDKPSDEILVHSKLFAYVCQKKVTAKDDEDYIIESAGIIGGLTRQKDVTKQPEVKNYIAHICEQLNKSIPKAEKAPLLIALQELLLDPSEDLIELVISHRGLNGVLRMQDENTSDWGTILRCQKIIDSIAEKKNLRTALMKESSRNIERVVLTTRKIAKAGKKEADIVALTLRNLNRIVTPEDSALLARSDILPDLEAVMAANPEHEMLLHEAALLMSKMGLSDMTDPIMKKIIHFCDTKPADWVKEVTRLNAQLAVFLAGDFMDPQKSLALLPQCLDALADAIKNGKEPGLITSVANVTRQIARNKRNNPNDPLGLLALRPRLMSTLVEVLSTDATDVMKRPRRLLIDGFITLAECAKNPAMRKDLLEQCKKMNLIAYCDVILHHHENDPEVITAVLEFLNAMADQPAAAEQIAAMLKTKGAKVVIPIDDADAVLKMLWKHRGHPETVEQAYELLARIAAREKTCPKSLANAQNMKDLEVLCQSDPKALVGQMNLRKKMIGKESHESTVAALAFAIAQNEVAQADPELSADDKTACQAALADFIGALADADMTEVLRKSNAAVALMEALERNPDDLGSMRKTIPAMKKMAEHDAEASARLAKNGIKIMLSDCLPVLESDFVACNEALKLLNVLAGTPGYGRLINEVPGFKELMLNMGTLEESLPEHEAKEIEALTQSLKVCVEDDQPETLTLQKVFTKWSARKSEGERLGLESNPVVVQHWDFVADYTEEYSKEPHKTVSNGLGLEWSYGCKCYQLLYEHEVNARTCDERNEAPHFFLRSMAKQREDAAAQCAVLVALDAVKHESSLQTWTSVPNASAVVAELLVRGRKASGNNAEKEQFLLPRMALMEIFAITRTYFNGTECMGALIGLWDDYDAGKYSIELLKQVFRSMRKIVNDHWVGVILKNNVPKRLIDVVADKSSNLEVLPDVLFLLAALAVVPEIKQMIGDLKGVEWCLDLLTRSLQRPADTGAVMTNDCLALSAITLGHSGNLTKFVNAKGLDLNIQAMDQSMFGKIDFDVANAASLLMCNNCFKRDMMKESYGKKGACQAVMKTINKYDGSDDYKAFRCLATMFKAIGNLALFTPNVDIFIAGHIEKTFADLYMKSDLLPDTLMEASLRTLSNLALENTKVNMERFGVCLTPILQMLNQGQRSSVKMFTLAFDVLGSLCRLPANSKQFLDQGGISVCLKILNSYSDSHLYANGVHVLGIQTTTPAAVDQLIDEGIFNFITSLFEAQCNAGDDLDQDLVIAGHRCTRRLLKSQDAIRAFVKAGALEQIASLMATSEEDTMLHLECHRTILNCLALFPPPAPLPSQGTRGTRDADWDGDVADEGVLPSHENIERPPGPRSWESVGLHPAMICSMIQSLCFVLRRDENVKQARFAHAALGLLAYFACEKIPGCVNAFYAARFGSTLERCFALSENDRELVKIGCYVINNVAFSSEPDLYVTLRRERAMRKELDVASQQLKGADKSFCDLTLRLLNEKSADTSRFEIHQQWTFPLELTWWDKDKYPMGVQDLPAEWKEELRTGGQLKLIQKDGNNREIITWRSTMDLSSITWKMGTGDGPWQFALAISRVCNISKGLASMTLRNANTNGSATTKPRDFECLVLKGLPCEDFPEGAELNLLCGLKRNRDHLFDLFTEWREAAAFGF